MRQPSPHNFVFQFPPKLDRHANMAISRRYMPNVGDLLKPPVLIIGPNANVQIATPRCGLLQLVCQAVETDARPVHRLREGARQVVISILGCLLSAYMLAVTSRHPRSAFVMRH
jgi:hypothetical protein